MMEEGSVSDTIPDLKDLELKIGRKTPDGLLKWMRDDSASHAGDGKLNAQECNDRDSSKNGLAEKIRDLKLDMAYLRSVDVKILRQLMALHEGIESVRWLLEERGTLTSRCSSLTSSQYSLAEGPDASLRGSWSSLHDPNDRLDNISIGSYLDTLADDLDEYGPPGSESTHGPAPLGAELCGRIGPRSGSPLVKGERPKGEAPLWANGGGESSRAPELRRVTPSTEDNSQALGEKNNGPLEKADKQASVPDATCSSLPEKMCQSAKAKPYKNGKIDLEGRMLNGLTSKVSLEYDARWQWAHSQDDVTFL